MNTSKYNSNSAFSVHTDSGVVLIVLICAVCVVAMIILTTIGIFLGKKEKATKESSEESSNRSSNSELKPNANAS